MALKSSPSSSPLANIAIREFLDGLAEIIADAVLQDAGYAGQPSEQGAAREEEEPC